VNKTSTVGPMHASPGPISTKTEREVVATAFVGWLLQTFLLIAAMSCVFVWAAVRTDMLGLHGRNDVKIHAIPRFSVYLMAYRFIPDNFNALLLGNSQAAVIDTSKIHTYKVFNAAELWGTMSEERTLGEQVLQHGHLKMAVLLLVPDLLSSHAIRSAYMTPHDYWSSFGSIQTLLIDYQAAREALGHPGEKTFDFDGRNRIPLYNGPPTRFTPDQLFIDPVEVRDMTALITHLHSKGVKVYVMFAPMYQAKWDAQREELLAWQSKVTADLTPGESELIELPDDVKNTLQSNRTNFPDYTHLSPSGSDTFAKAIDGIIADKNKTEHLAHR
jgi:hypothetical protein